jgi:hypothetical protein
MMRRKAGGRLLRLRITAPISVIRSPDAQLPVVSTSTTT